ncbi:MAG: hypothetical protein LBR38_04415 [Synergistaceae bacterium]|jgi:hypothetical protein|nr:hypothetical protein [Synergistaceae bacterium]
MRTTKSEFAECVKKRRFKDLFIDCLGWNNAKTREPVEFDGVPMYVIAEKQGFQIVECRSLPLSGDRARLASQLKRRFHEHLLIFHNGTAQIWRYRDAEIRIGQDQDVKRLAPHKARGVRPIRGGL